MFGRGHRSRRCFAVLTGSSVEYDFEHEYDYEYEIEEPQRIAMEMSARPCSTFV